MGYVIENPNGVYSEQPDPIPEEQFTFEVKCVLCKVYIVYIVYITGGVWVRRCVDSQAPTWWDYHASLYSWVETNKLFSLFKIFHSAINCTEPPFQVRNNDMGMYNWTGVDGEDPRPFATSIEYFCPREGWGYPRSDKKYFNSDIFQSIFEFMIFSCRSSSRNSRPVSLTISLSVRLFNIIHDVIML